MKVHFNIYYLCAFIIMFIVEAVIAVFIRDNFIRPYIGDILVVVLIYCFIKAFVKTQTVRLPVYIFIFAALVEVGQYFNLVERLRVGNNTMIRIMIGSTFDIKDIACYLTGCALLWVFEMVIRKTTHRSR